MRGMVGLVVWGTEGVDGGLDSWIVLLLTAKAVIVLRVLGLISAGMNARMKFGTLS